MRLLLDTHTFIWWDSEPSNLSPKALSLCQDKDNALILSVASLWEMQIKSRLGKLKLSMPLPRLVEGQEKVNAHQLLSVHAPLQFSFRASVSFVVGSKINDIKEII